MFSLVERRHYKSLCLYIFLRHHCTPSGVSFDLHLFDITDILYAVLFRVTAVYFFFLLSNENISDLFIIKIFLNID